jgi:hypothetical protein
MGLRQTIAERRRARRFQVAWPVIIKGCDSKGLKFEEKAALENLSSSGAFVHLNHPVPVGATLDLSIKIPMKKENWISYSAEVVRSDPEPSGVALAVRFKSFHPVFG